MKHRRNQKHTCFQGLFNDDPLDHPKRRSVEWRVEWPVEWRVEWYVDLCVFVAAPKRIGGRSRQIWTFFFHADSQDSGMPLEVQATIFRFNSVAIELGHFQLFAGPWRIVSPGQTTSSWKRRTND